MDNKLISEETKIIGPEDQEAKIKRARDLLEQAIAEKPTAVIVLCRTSQDTMMIAGVGGNAEMEALLIKGSLNLLQTIDKTEEALKLMPGPHGPH